MADNQPSSDPWYRTPVERKVMKRLMRRNDRDGLLYLGGYLVLLIASGALASVSLGTWWAVPAFLLYGGLWVFATSIVHETSHGTAFKTRWLNETVLFLAGLMVQQTPTGLRWTHARHHSETSIVGKDVEIVLTNPMTWAGLWLRQLGDVGSIWFYCKTAVLFALGKIDSETKDCVPDDQLPRVAWEARAYLVIYLAIVAWALIAQTWWPVLMFLVPRLAGAPTHGLMLACQHIGLAQNHYDHRISTRTMHVNPLLKFIYWNMNYHIEHHMFPQVPFHALPALHEEIKADSPPPTEGLFGALREMLATVARQQREPGYALPRALPSA